MKRAVHGRALREEHLMPSDPVFERWPGYTEQSWPERFAELDRRFQQERDLKLAHIIAANTRTTLPSEEADVKYLITKNGLYYRPNAQGYTANVAEAGRFTLKEAERNSHPNGLDGPRDGIRYEPAPEATPKPEPTEDHPSDAVLLEAAKRMGWGGQHIPSFLCRYKTPSSTADRSFRALVDVLAERDAMQAEPGIPAAHEAIRAALKTAYEDGAVAVHDAWINGEGGRDPDFGEAAGDYADHHALEVCRQAGFTEPTPDPDLVLADQLAAKFESRMVTPYPPARLEALKEMALEALKLKGQAHDH
jgi:hypothetical protein